MVLNRRNFIKNCSVGIGAIMASNALLGKLLAGEVPQPGSKEFTDLYGLSVEDIQKLLVLCMSKGGDFADLYFEYRVSNSVTMEEDIIKSSSEGITLGVGVRVIKGEQTGYGYTNDISFDKVRAAALTAAAIAADNAKVLKVDLSSAKPVNNTYDMAVLLTDRDLTEKINLVKEAYNAAKNFDSRIIKVSASIGDEIQYVTIANTDGLLISDVRPMARLSVSATAEDKNVKNTGFHSGGGRVGLNFYKNVKTPTEIGKKAAEEAVILLSAKNASPGEQIVVLGKNQSGVMIHEAVGHPLEADGNWKKTSVMTGKMGQMVANPIVTIYDDATIPNYRGSLNIDDEGTNTENVMLIENGKLVGYLNDKLAAKILKEKPNGHGRRQSFAFPPIPRMNNTVLGKGKDSPEDIIKSVKKGFYADTYQGGMVDSSGKFTFSVNLGYLIEDGKLTTPLKNATLIGQNLEILKNIDMIGNDTGFFLGTCGKDGQSVPVTAGTPTLRISKMTVGGVA